MENWIRHVREPQKLLLAWQAPDHMPTRHRWAVGVVDRGTDGAPASLRYFRADDEFEEFNGGRTFAVLQSLGYEGFPGFRLKQDLHTAGVADAFVNRLPPRGRPDFVSYMKQFRLPADASISTFALLGHTEAKLPSDGFSLVDQLDADDESCDLLLEIAGYRHYVSQADAPFGSQIGDAIEIQSDPSNPYDAGAVRFKLDGHMIGNVNRLQAPAFLAWLKYRKVTAVLERLNGKPGKPRAFVFVRVRPSSVQLAA